MSKAEDKARQKALEKFPILFGERMGYDKTNLQQERRNAYEKGYHQAEKDLEMGWEDMEKVFDLCYEVLRDVYLMKFPDDKEEQKEFYQEVLKRFNRERKDKARKGIV